VIVDSLPVRIVAGLSAVALWAVVFDAGVRGAAAAPAPERAASPVGARPHRDSLTKRANARAPETGAEIFRATCAGCHGNGQGAPQTTVAFAVPVPDFTNCGLTTPETTVDYAAIIRDGGPVRSFSRIMPAFRDLLTPEQIRRVVAYMRSLCSDPAWPRGEFNVPLAQVTEKAFPEDEILLKNITATRGPGVVQNHFIIEKRFLKRDQLEVDVPFVSMQRPESSWVSGLGDASITVKHVFLANVARGTIVSTLAGVVFPTGNPATGFGTGTASFEAFILGAQLLPALGRTQIIPPWSYFQYQAGVSLPTNPSRAPRTASWSGALGTTFGLGPITRIWSPMVEVTGTRALVSGAPVDWSVVPQFQVSLSALQHVRASVGVDVPLTQRDTRSTQIVAYILWDTFDGPLFQGWKGWCPGCEH